MYLLVYKVYPMKYEEGLRQKEGHMGERQREERNRERKREKIDRKEGSRQREDRQRAKSPGAHPFSNSDRLSAVFGTRCTSKQSLVQLLCLFRGGPQSLFCTHTRTFCNGGHEPFSSLRWLFRRFREDVSLFCRAEAQHHAGRTPPCPPCLLPVKRCA